MVPDVTPTFPSKPCARRAPCWVIVVGGGIRIFFAGTSTLGPGNVRCGDDQMSPKKQRKR